MRFLVPAILAVLLHGASFAQTINEQIDSGNAAVNAGRYDDAIALFQHALQDARAAQDRPGEAKGLERIGLAYEFKGDYAKALEHHFSALRIYDVLKDQAGISTTTGHIGIVYDNLRDFDKAIEYYSKAIALDSARKDMESLSGNLHNLGGVYAQTGKLDDALRLTLQAMEINKRIGKKDWLALNVSSIANIYVGKGQLDEALKYYDESLRLSAAEGDDYGRTVSLISIGDVYYKRKQFDPALDYYRQALEVVRRTGAVDYEQLTLQRLAAVSQQVGDYQSALDYFERYTILKDSLYNQENTKKIVEQRMQYEFDKKEALAAAELQRTRTIQWAFAGGFAIVLVFAVVVWRQRNRINEARKRSDELLLNILPEEVAEELKERGSAEARHFDHVTVMFTDFKGFTALSELVSPAELVSEIDTCFRAFDAITEQLDVEKIKTIGDSYMCAAGLPRHQEDHALLVVQAALQIRDFMLRHAEERRAAGRPAFEIRIGVHTGPVVAGIVGVKKFQYDIWGDTVNTASRMESSGEPGKVNISASTFELVRDRFVCQHRGQIDAKGKGALDMYFVEKPLELASSV